MNCIRIGLLRGLAVTLLALIWGLQGAAAQTLLTSENVTPLLSVSRGGIVLDRVSQTYKQVITLTNTSKRTVTPPVYLAIGGLVTDITLTDSVSEIPLAVSKPLTTRYLVVSGEAGLAPGDTISIVLKYVNRKNLRISYGLEVVAHGTSGAEITGIEPPTATSGVLVTIRGQGFSRQSVIYLGDSIITQPQFVSTGEMRFIVPLDVTSSVLAALPPGTYPVTVDDSNGQDLNVVGLPVSTVAPGSILSSHIAAQAVRAQADADSASSALAKLQATDPNMAALFAELLNARVLSAKIAAEQAANMQSGGDLALATLIDRLLLAQPSLPPLNGPLTTSALAVGGATTTSANNAAAAASDWGRLFQKSVCVTGVADASGLPLGDQCLIARKGLVDRMKAAEQISKPIKYTCKALEVAAVAYPALWASPQVATCLANSIVAFAEGLLYDSVMLFNYGNIVDVELYAGLAPPAKSQASVLYPKFTASIGLSDRPESGIPASVTLERASITMQPVVSTSGLILAISSYVSLSCKTAAIGVKEACEKAVQTALGRTELGAKVVKWLGVVPKGTGGPPRKFPVSLSKLGVGTASAPGGTCSSSKFNDRNDGALYLDINLPLAWGTDKQGSVSIKEPLEYALEYTCPGIDVRFNLQRDFALKEELELQARFVVSAHKLVKILAESHSCGGGKGSVSAATESQSRAVFGKILGCTSSSGMKCQDYFSRVRRRSLATDSWIDDVELVASPDSGSIFLGWGGGCLDPKKGVCQLPMSQVDNEAWAKFSRGKPKAVNDSASTTSGKPVTIKITDNDTDASGKPLPQDVTVTNVTLADPSKGTVTNNQDGTITFTPNAGVTGSVSISYQLTTPCDDISNLATVAVAVAGDSSGGGDKCSVVNGPVDSYYRPQGAFLKGQTLKCANLIRNGQVVRWNEMGQMDVRGFKVIYITQIVPGNPETVSEASFSINPDNVVYALQKVVRPGLPPLFRYQTDVFGELIPDQIDRWGFVYLEPSHTRYDLKGYNSGIIQFIKYESSGRGDVNATSDIQCQRIRYDYSISKTINTTRTTRQYFEQYNLDGCPTMSDINSLNDLNLSDSIIWKNNFNYH